MKIHYLFVVLFLFIFNNFSSQLLGEDCSNAIVISSLPYIASGNTNNANDDYFASCPDYGNQGGANDIVYQFTNGANDIYVDISLCQDITDYDCQLYVFENNCTNSPVGCQEDGCQSPNYSAPYNSKITAQFFNANTTYYIVVDGYSATSNGNYQLNINESIGLNAPDSTNIPLIIINTNNQIIVDEPKINVDFKIIDNYPLGLNYPSDSGNVYQGIAGIEIRGSYSATLPQKPFGIETRDIQGNNNNVPLFGMPQENDWILLANYNDKTFLRNVLAFDLFEKMGHYAPRTKLCEVVINDIYNGIYVFTEKIKRDNGRVDISKLDLDDNAGDSLTGGYIFRVDYWNGNNSWVSNYNNPNFPNDEVRYVYNYPDYDEISIQQKNYIQTLVGDFEDALWGSDFDDPIFGYRPFINTRSFIDYFIVNEFARNVDGFKKSRNFHKDKSSKDSLIYAGPVWDFDWAYKDHSSSMLNGAGWRHDYSGPTDVRPPGWYIKLLQDTTFANELNCRYFNLRNTILDTSNLFYFIDSLENILNNAQERHYTRWPILGVNVGTPEIGIQPTTYSGEIIKFKNWISERLTWLDNNMPGNCPNVGLNELKKTYVVTYPNPSLETLNIYSESEIKEIIIYDNIGREIKSLSNLRRNNISLDVKKLKGFFRTKIILSNGQIIKKNIISY
ncbi:MAG: CotH kinase family protein [Flavobacteriales bacterium]|nr:CotH kinase family protein [Flavobacteriales bacterium]